MNVNLSPFQSNLSCEIVCCTPRHNVAVSQNDMYHPGCLFDYRGLMFVSAYVANHKNFAVRKNSSQREQPCLDQVVACSREGSPHKAVMHIRLHKAHFCV